MASLETINLLIDRATEEKNAAAQSFAIAVQRKNQAQQKLQLLTTYRREYEDMLYKKTQQGVSGTEINNYNRFIRQLGEAILQQEQEVDKAESYQEMMRIALAESERKLKSYEILQTREQNKILHKEAVRDQKATDEYANRLAAYSQRET